MSIDEEIIHLGKRDPVRRLQEFFDKCSNPSFDRSTRRCLYMEESIKNVHHRQLFPLMVQVLNLPGPTDSDGVEVKWLSVHFEGCVFSQPDSTARPEHYDSTLDDIYHMLSTIAHRATKMWICRSPDMVTCLLKNPHLDHLQVEELYIRQHNRLSDLEYSRLSTLIQRNAELKQLTLAIPLEGIPLELFDGVANCVQLQSLCLRSNKEPYGPQSEEAISNLVVGDGGKEVVARLLRNPRHQLRELDLFCMDLADHHLVALVKLLPTSRIEVLDLSDNEIHTPGFLEFARQLPRMQSLKRTCLSRNRWEATDHDCNICGEALVQALRENTNIRWLDWLQLFPQAPLLWYYLVLNQAGRKILNPSSQAIPDGLWPYILARKPPTYNNVSHDHDIYQQKFNIEANVVYYFLQNVPKLLFFQR